MEERPHDPPRPEPPGIPGIPAEPGAMPPVAPEDRLPLRGKMVAPTASPPTADRMANILRIQRARRRRGFMIGLLAGQLLIVGLDLGGELLIRAVSHKVVFNAPIPFRAVVFLGMTAGIAAIGLLIGLLLGFQGLGWIFGRKKVGFLTALCRGFRRMGRAALSIGLTLAVIGSTAWFMIPGSEWRHTAGWLDGKRRTVVEWVKRQVAPRPPGEWR